MFIRLSLISLIFLLHIGALDSSKSLEEHNRHAAGMSEVELAQEVKKYDAALREVREELEAAKTHVRQMPIEDLVGNGGRRSKKRLHDLKTEWGNLAERRGIYASGLR